MNQLRAMLRFSAPLVPAGLAVFISLYINRFALNHFGSLEDVGHFGIGSRIAGLVALLILGIQAALTPLVYQHYREPQTPGQIARLFDFGRLGMRLRSGEIRRVHVECRATVGEVGNEEHGLRKIGKAGANRWRGIRPTVRGVAMNPVDHPHGGGEGRTGEAREPVSPWGTPAKGYRTRSNKRTDGMIVQRRHKR